MKTIPRNSYPYSAALYLRKCAERKQSAEYQRTTSFNRMYRAACLAIAGLAILCCGLALAEIAIILSK